jgi:predicted DCC family thiol-disulfide oxidoreductase YuxK
LQLECTIPGNLVLLSDVTFTLRNDNTLYFVDEYSQEYSRDAEPATLFYDGDCGFCHGSVRFLAAHDRHGAFRFAPLGGPTFLALVPEAARAGLPDSLVIRTADGRILVQSDAALHCLRQLGGGFRALAALVAFVPRPLREAAYAAFARNRLRWFARPKEACPVPPGALRARLDP